MTPTEPDLELRGVPSAPALSACLAHWSDALRRRGTDPAECRVLVERSGWPPLTPLQVAAHVVLIHNGHVVLAISDACAVDANGTSGHEQEATTALDRAFAATVDELTRQGARVPWWGHTEGLAKKPPAAADISALPAATPDVSAAALG